MWLRQLTAPMRQVCHPEKEQCHRKGQFSPTVQSAAAWSELLTPSERNRPEQNASSCDPDKGQTEEQGDSNQKSEVRGQTSGAEVSCCCAKLREVRAQCVLILIGLVLFAEVPAGGDVPRERIVYTTVRPANWELYAFDHGAAPKQLTNDPALDYDPTVSPDGKSVAFSSDRDTWIEAINDRSTAIRCEIYLMNIDGSNPRRLTNSNAFNGSPAWSRDGKTIYFYSNRDGGAFRIWAMEADGGHPRTVTPKERPGFSPAVMPGGRIAFAEKTADGFRVASVAADGSDIRIESGTQQDCRSPAFDQRDRMVCTGKGSLAGMLLVSNGRPFLARGAHEEIRLPDRIVDLQAVHRPFCSISPDGREFASGQLVSDDSSSMRLMINRLDGSNAREIFQPPNSDNVWATSWARRANVIAFTTGPQFAPNDAIVDVWTVRADSSKPPTNLTSGKFRNNAFPDLTADGKEMVFRSTRDGNKEIYLMNSDGTDVRRITNNPADDTMPSIAPSGDMMAFSSDRAGGQFQIYLQPIKDGKPDGPPRQFTHGFSPNMHSRFSPDGKWLVYASARGWLNDEYPLSNDNPQPYGELFVAPIDGHLEPIRLTHNKWEDSIPSWGVLSTSDR